MEKYSINVHFDMVSSVEVYACSEDEALSKAENLAGDRDSLTFDCVNVDSCITDVEKIVGIDEEKEVIKKEVNEDSPIDYGDESIEQAIDQLYEEKDGDFDSYSLEEIVWLVEDILNDE